MTLTELRYIVAVAQERHFGRAARRCFVSQPTLSIAIKKLEEELSVSLFDRSSNDIITTEAGERIVAQARRVLEEVELIKHPFLVGQPADHDRQHPVRIDRKPQLLLHAGLVLDFVAQIMEAVVGTDQRVGLRIPDRLVNAVEDAREALAPLQQHALHANTALQRD